MILNPGKSDLTILDSAFRAYSDFFSPYLQFLKGIRKVSGVLSGRRAFRTYFPARCAGLFSGVALRQSKRLPAVNVEESSTAVRRASCPPKRAESPLPPNKNSATFLFFRCLCPLRSAVKFSCPRFRVFA